LNPYSTALPEALKQAQALCAQAQGRLARGDRLQALNSCVQALALDRDCVLAHHLIASISLAGWDYMELLRRIHEHLRPRTYLEVGVASGNSIRLAGRETIAIGVDPAPRIEGALPATTRIFREASDDFFARVDLRREYGGADLDLAFIDGMHLFEFALRDFVNVERNSAPGTVVLIHDCYPLDEITAARDQTTTFSTGDVWKLILCLRKYRPDLRVHTLAAVSSGLALVRGLNSQSTLLADQHDSLCREFIPMPYSAIAASKAEALNLMPGDWETARGLLA
jgi:hypothetical protein